MILTRQSKVVEDGKVLFWEESGDSCWRRRSECNGRYGVHCEGETARLGGNKARKRLVGGWKPRYREGERRREGRSQRSVLVGCMRT